jgi:hypothetical protein
MSDKILPSHLERKAILYVRQSSTYQVTHNEESRRLQYAMRDGLRGTAGNGSNWWRCAGWWTPC